MPGGKPFEDFFEKHVNSVYRMCAVRLGNRADAEDVTQETFFRASQNREVWTMYDEGHARAWLITTAGNLCSSKNRHWLKTRRVELEEWVREFGVVPPPDEERREVLDAVLRLREPYKTAIYLFYYERYSGAEIALMLDKKESTVRSLLHRGRKMLGKALGGA